MSCCTGSVYREVVACIVKKIVKRKPVKIEKRKIVPFHNVIKMFYILISTLCNNQTMSIMTGHTTSPNVLKLVCVVTL